MQIAYPQSKCKTVNSQYRQKKGYPHRDIPKKAKSKFDLFAHKPLKAVIFLSTLEPDTEDLYIP